MPGSNQHSTLGAGRTAQPRDLSARLEYLRNPEVRLELGDAAWTAQRAALVDELAAQYEEIAVRADERLKMLNEYATDLATAVEEKRGLQEQLQTAQDAERLADSRYFDAVKQGDVWHAAWKQAEAERDGLLEQLEAARGLLVRARPLCIEAYEKRRGAAVQPLKDDITKWLDSNPASEPKP